MPSKGNIVAGASTRNANRAASAPVFLPKSDRQTFRHQSLTVSGKKFIP
jgi:hypothetical protein